MNKESGIIIAFILAVLAIVAVYSVLAGTVELSEDSIDELYDEYVGESEDDAEDVSAVVQNSDVRSVSGRCPDCVRERQRRL